jgi:hypothetical protein
MWESTDAVAVEWWAKAGPTSSLSVTETWTYGLHTSTPTSSQPITLALLMGAKVGIGVSIPIVFIIIVFCIFFSFQWRKQRELRSQQPINREMLVLETSISANTHKMPTKSNTNELAGKEGNEKRITTSTNTHKMLTSSNTNELVGKEGNERHITIIDQNRDDDSSYGVHRNPHELSSFYNYVDTLEVFKVHSESRLDSNQRQPFRETAL